MACSDPISALSDITVAVAAIVAAFIAWRGLTTWRDQMRGTVEYDLARRVLKGVYRVRDAVARVRDPFMFSAEMPEPPRDQAEKMNNDQIRYYGVSKAYEARWNLVVEARRELDAELLEAEVLWGQDIKGRREVLWKLEHRLLIAVRHHLRLQNPAENNEVKEITTKRYRDGKEDEILYGGFEEETNQFSDDYSKAIRGLEDYLRPHLRRP